MGVKSEAKIIQAIENYLKTAGRFHLDVGFLEAEKIIQALRPTAEELVAAGSLRRRRDTVGDLDILAVASDGPALIKSFVNHPQTAAILAEGTTRCAIRLENGLQVDLRIMEKQDLGSALLYFTGSKAHNIALRRRAKAMGLKVSEYGIFQNGESIAGRTEEECYQALSLPWIPPNCERIEARSRPRSEAISPG